MKSHIDELEEKTDAYWALILDAKEILQNCFCLYMVIL